jgi:fatty aldehyde decarbonylase
MANAAIEVKGDVGEPTGRIVRDESRGEKYYNLIAFISSNAIAGELTAINNYSEMVHLVPDLDTKLHLIHQAQEEAGHVKSLTALCNRLGVPVANRVVEPEWHKMRKNFSEAAQKGDLAACIIMQDVMIETMAIVLYRTMAGLESADTDAETTRVAKALLDDELEHLAFGNESVQRLAAADPDGVNDSLVWAHHRTMPELFHLIRNGCDTLCDELGVECGSFGVEEMKTDLDTLRMSALDTYVESLDRAGFDPKVTAPLIASMSAYEGMPRASVGAGACSPESGCC